MHSWRVEAYQYLIKGDYGKAASLYEQAIACEPDVKSYYWYLGLLLLLQGQEAEAQMTWLAAMVKGEPEQVELWTTELVQVLQVEAQRREVLADYSVAWAIRQHLREMNPSDINNLLQIIQLSILLDRTVGNDLTELGVIELLRAGQTISLDSELLVRVLQNVLAAAPLHLASLEFAEACLHCIQDTSAYLSILMSTATKLGYTLAEPRLAARLLEIYLRLDAENIQALRCIATFYQNYCDFSKGIETAKLCYALSSEVVDKIAGINLVLRGLMGASGYWEEVQSAYQELESLLRSLIETQPITLTRELTLVLLTPAFFLPHIKDDPCHFRSIHNQVAQLFQANVQSYAKEQAHRYNQRRINSQRLSTPGKILKIGYLSHCFRRHSVGWLARWVFQYHDRDRFEIHTYFINYRLTENPLQEWYVNQASQSHKLGMDGLTIAEQVYQDEIDILIDLDSITLDVTSEVMALKPAPVQVTWLGWDASGIPAIDYFIADPYVIPDSAQNYYLEKIWRLPQTYIAVDGFEVGVPTLRRERLDIPSDAVVYLSAQRGYKRHPDTVRLQMKILQAVPNSYFLIGGVSDTASIQSFFYQIAEEEGVSCDRLIFLPPVTLEATHRGNLGIADVVLDTYPYNGATTTLETLWMCIPIVTRVGQQFAARNSYTMMMNVGVTEGIAWTDQEYVEWGVRLGKDPALRQHIAWKLRQSRQTSPLWNAKQFTREMEKAYEQMWQNYISVS